MKIGGLIILLIILTVFSALEIYRDKPFYDLANNLCDIWKDVEVSTASDYELEQLERCTINRRLSRAWYRVDWIVTTTFLFLVILSWEIDKIKKH